MRLKSPVAKSFGRAFRYLAGGSGRGAAQLRRNEKRRANRLARHVMNDMVRKGRYEDIPAAGLGRGVRITSRDVV